MGPTYAIGSPEWRQFTVAHLDFNKVKIKVIGHSEKGKIFVKA